MARRFSWPWNKKKKQVLSDSKASPSKTYTQNPTVLLTAHEIEKTGVGYEGGARPTAEEKKPTPASHCKQNLQVPKSLPQSNSSSSLHSVSHEKPTDGCPGRPRGYSDVSTSSYHTCKGSKSSLVPKHSPTSSRPGTPNVLELRMQGMEERMAGLEKKMETIESFILRQNMQQTHKESGVQHNHTTREESGIQRSPSPKEKKRDERLSALEEEDESATDLPKTKCVPSEKTQGDTKSRRFTDSDAEKLTQYRKSLQKRKEFTRQKAVSLHGHRHQLPQKQCSQEVIVWLTQRITHWKFIARWLGLQDSDVETIATNNPQDVREQCYQMFKKWRSTDPGNFTYHVLGEALRREGQMKLFNEYVEEVHRVHRVENTIDVPDHD